MVEQIVNMHCPYNWRTTYDGHYKLIDLQSDSMQYAQLKILTAGTFNKCISRIARVENPYLYAQFLLKKEEYETRGIYRTLQLFHDTAESKIDSILTENLDWRLANRVKYGQGVSFSPSAAYANRESSRSNGPNRALIVADVLVQREQFVSESLVLPRDSCDTTVGNGKQVYVKYYDDEFYPKFVIFYESNPRVFYRRW